MFGRFNPVAFDPYARRRKHRKVPAWLVLLAGGLVAGAAAVLLVQERYLPPRLSAEASEHLKTSFEQADKERTRLKAELADTARQLERAVADNKRLADELAASRRASDDLRQDLAALVESLPADPRGGAVQVRAARFRTEGAKLLYDVVLSRERAGGKALSGVMQVVLAGAGKRGADTTVKLEPVAISVKAFESLRGGLALPEGFDPREATIHVLDRPEGKLLGMRVLKVK
ncbi:hypothetical protein [Ideonella sp. BN130291]|uniref:hypothetical protein n=1 Tax=Ideonella sp. BN130291 TaxID=3112940 RepID=UPI002E2568A3|nr:hypothetical protein [Ideonella sp. BN130291]